MDLRELKRIWQKADFMPRKRLGQNFLIDKNVKRKIIGAVLRVCDSPGIILEIGPGFGVMTFALADIAERVIAVDKDDSICGIMEPYFNEKGNIELINQDIMKFDVGGILEAEKGKKITVYGNIPYYISTPIIEKLIDAKEHINEVFIVMQDELVNRIVSSPGTKDYGSLSCYIQYHTKPEKIFKIKQSCFYPRPKVDSSLMRLSVLDKPGVTVKDEALLFQIIRKAFSQRRKKAVNPLGDGSIHSLNRDDWLKLFARCSLDPSARAEDLSIENYADLANLV